MTAAPRRAKCSIFDVNLEPIAAGDTPLKYLLNGTVKLPYRCPEDRKLGWKKESYVSGMRPKEIAKPPGADATMCRQEIEDDAACRCTVNGSPYHNMLKMLDFKWIS